MAPSSFVKSGYESIGTSARTDLGLSLFLGGCICTPLFWRGGNRTAQGSKRAVVAPIFGRWTFFSLLQRVSNHSAQGTHMGCGIPREYKSLVHLLAFRLAAG